MVWNISIPRTIWIIAETRKYLHKSLYCKYHPFIHIKMLCSTHFVKKYLYFVNILLIWLQLVLCYFCYCWYGMAIITDVAVSIIVVILTDLSVLFRVQFSFIRTDLIATQKTWSSSWKSYYHPPLIFILNYPLIFILNYPLIFILNYPLIFILNYYPKILNWF